MVPPNPPCQTVFTFCAYAERFVWPIKHECIDKMTFFRRGMSPRYNVGAFAVISLMGDDVAVIDEMQLDTRAVGGPRNHDGKASQA